MATLIALGSVCVLVSACMFVCVCKLLTSKRSCKSAASLGKVNLAVADGSDLITAWELWSVSQ